MYGHRYGTSNSGITRAIAAERHAAKYDPRTRPYSMTLTDGTQVKGVAHCDGAALTQEEFRGWVNGLSEPAYQAATVVLRFAGAETLVPVAAIAKLN